MAYGSALIDSISSSGNLSITGNVTTTGLITSSIGVTYPLLYGGSASTATGTTTVTVATNIPSWVQRITVVLNGVSLSGTSMPLIQFGTGSTPTYVTSGYNSVSDNYTSTPGPAATSTAGFRICSTLAASSLIYAQYVFLTTGVNSWVGSLNGYVTTSSVLFGGGVVTLGAPITAIRLNTVNGTDSYDAGIVGIYYE